MKFFLGLLALAVSGSAWAGEGLFSRVYTTETVPGHHFEVEQLLRNRSGRAHGEYSAFDSRTEFEYGISDNLQAAFYLNTGFVHATNSPDDDSVAHPNGSFSRDKDYIQGISTEFIYRVLSPVTDGVGLAFYFEPEIDFYDPHNGLKYNGTFGTEYRILLQKNFLDDQLIIAFNTVFETEFIRFDGEDSWKGELDWNNELGVSYRVMSNFYAGLELRNHNEFGNFAIHEHSIYWAGPAVHYGGSSFWATFGVLRQVYGVPNGITDDGTNIGNSEFLRSHEKWELTAKAAIPF